MKAYKIITASLLLFQVTLSANELSWVDTQVDAIKPARVGMNNSETLKLQDPFIFYKKGSAKNKKATNVAKSSIRKSSDATIKKGPKPMKLTAIINNSALINGEWYRVDQNIAGFMVSSITRTNVVLTKGKKKLVLTTNDQNKNLKFK
ncbi:hypothetical protein M947_02235 [Sulfurimonas hongkongensis]|uniref:Uncharacterized protein n=1 Tax=Sulfurimonas hongkongensis TaxID=1172190 RepID=T0L450_9BACT|nr:hypothetical protein [Sulfurimonas hongkongensis]EQB40648.1 hypothetical protein M947_02235 [Sulfurimonas hongkongensis]